MPIAVRVLQKTEFFRGKKIGKVCKYSSIDGPRLLLNKRGKAYLITVRDNEFFFLNLLNRILELTTFCESSYLYEAQLQDLYIYLSWLYNCSELSLGKP